MIRSERTLERLLRRIEITEAGCWEFMGARMPSGYGRIGWGSILDGTRETALAHRVAYTLMVGPIPDGLHIDHLCRNKACVRPEHLEPVTIAENNRRVAALKSACPQGHSYDDGNLYVDPRGSRQCRTCRRARHAEWMRKKGATA